MTEWQLPHYQVEVGTCPNVRVYVPTGEGGEPMNENDCIFAGLMPQLADMLKWAKELEDTLRFVQAIVTCAGRPEQTDEPTDDTMTTRLLTLGSRLNTCNILARQVKTALVGADCEAVLRTASDA